MCFVKCYILFFCLVIIENYALNCRTNGGLKESDLKNMYNKCLIKMQGGKNSTNDRENDDQNWNGHRGHNPRHNWERSKPGSKDNKMRNRNNDMENSDDSTSNDSKSNRRDNKGSNSDRTSNDRKNNSDRSDKMGSNNRMGHRNDMTGSYDGRGKNDNINGRNDFHSDEYSDMTQYNGYYSSSPPPRRYKRERRVDNSGQRSQYNPNAKKASEIEEENRSDEMTSSENNTSTSMDNNKACALHCFLENLEMTGDDGIPDKYLVTHAITKDVKNEDLKDFLQESIDECFQMLENENTEDKCEFSKNLLICMSEKGRANCDDWKDDISI